MTAPCEDDPGDVPLVMGAGQLAEVISTLFADSRRDGCPQAHVCGHGLHLTVGTRKGDVIALSRPEGEPSLEEKPARLPRRPGGRTAAPSGGWCGA